MNLETLVTQKVEIKALKTARAKKSQTEIRDLKTAEILEIQIIENLHQEEMTLEILEEITAVKTQEEENHQGRILREDLDRS